MKPILDRITLINCKTEQNAKKIIEFIENNFNRLSAQPQTKIEEEMLTVDFCKLGVQQQEIAQPQEDFVPIETLKEIYKEKLIGIDDVWTMIGLEQKKKLIRDLQHPGFIRPNDWFKYFFGANFGGGRNQIDYQKEYMKYKIKYYKLKEQFLNNL
jgi:hypothetical protein